MVDVVATHLQVTYDRALLRNKVFESIMHALAKSGRMGQWVMSDTLSSCIDLYHKEQWNTFQEYLILSVPCIGERYWGKLTWGAFTDAVCMANYEELIERERISSRYEIYIAIGGLTVNKTGVAYYEIAPEKSFTDDLGID
ncbi:hypothetical protein FLA_0670 [Filimonas lacunae]|nr:hypothetical protein FLA_0670 [Filimonas lacunae]